MRDTGRRIDVPVAFLTWLAAWLLGQIVALVVYSAGGYEDLDEVPIWVLFVTQLVIWGIFVVGDGAGLATGRNRAVPRTTTRLTPGRWICSAFRSGCSPNSSSFPSSTCRWSDSGRTCSPRSG